MKFNALLFSTFLFLLSAPSLFAQDTQGYTYNLYVKSKKGGPDAGRDVVFIESTTFERIALKTNSTGRLTHVFDHGEKWLGSIGEMRNCIEIIVGRGRGNAELTYDPEGYARENRIKPDRRSINFKKVSQRRINPNSRPEQGQSILNLVLVDQKRKVYPGVDVSIVCFETATVYEGRTNANGAATFKLPNNQDYEIDVDGVQSLHYVDIGARSSMRTMQLLYQPRTFTEKKEDRFVVQNVPANVEPSSSHARIRLRVSGGPKGGIEEDVYVRMLKSNTVYKAKTNDQGEVTLMLPIRAKYMVDFKYQKDADKIDLSRAKGIANQEMTVVYRPDPRLANIENFIPKVNELIEYDINNFVNKQYPDPTSNDVDFYLKWGNKFNKQSKEALLEIGLKVRPFKKRKSLDPLNICFVIDRSGSMDGEDRIEQVKRSLIQFIERLEPTDIVSIVVFNGSATLAVPAEPLGDKKKAIDIVHAIRASGGTNIYDGMVMGFEEACKKKTAQTIDRVVLLTDGYGSTPPGDVIAKAKSYIKRDVELSAVGVGVGYNQALLSQLASAGGGLLHLAGHSTNIQEVFQKEMESILYPMAKEANLTVKYNDQIIYRQLYGYTDITTHPGLFQVNIPHLFPGLGQMALVKLDLIDAKKAIEKEPVIVTLTYTDALNGEKVKIEKKLKPEWTEATGELDMAIDKEHKKVLAVAIANQSLKVMANSFEAGDKKAAEAAVQSAIEQIQTLFPDAKPEELLAVVERLTEYVRAFEDLRAAEQY